MRLLCSSVSIQIPMSVPKYQTSVRACILKFQDPNWIRIKPPFIYFFVTTSTTRITGETMVRTLPNRFLSSAMPLSSETITLTFISFTQADLALPHDVILLPRSSFQSERLA